MKKTENHKKRNNFTLKPEIDKILREIAEETGIKMSTIVERGILLFKEKLK